MSDRMWDVTLKHARECVLGDKLYIFREPNLFVILNPICEVMKAIVDGREAQNQVYISSIIVS